MVSQLENEEGTLAKCVGILHLEKIRRSYKNHLSMEAVMKSRQQNVLIVEEHNIHSKPKSSKLELIGKIDSSTSKGYDI